VDIFYYLKLPKVFKVPLPDIPAQKKAPDKCINILSEALKNGGYLLSHIIAVPSTWTGLTSLFGMGRGGTLSL
jgi:hypothetical protein